MKLVYVYVRGNPNAPITDPGPIAYSKALGDQVVIDYDHDGDIYGVEIIGAQRVEESDSRDGENNTLNARLHRAREKVRDYLSKGEHA